MIAWLEIDADPPLAFYRDPAALALISADLACPYLTGIGALRRPMAIPGILAGESPNISINLDNVGGHITRLFAGAPPMRQIARIQSDNGELFTGLVTDIDLSENASITLEAGLIRPMSDKVPLRATTAWGVYTDVKTIPVPYGRVTLAAIKYDDAGKVWVVADGAIAGVDTVRIQGAESQAWTWRNGVDRAGHGVAFLELANPADDAPVVSLRGRVHPLRGHMMVLPDEIVWDVLTNVCGLGVVPAQIDAFRSEVVGLEIGGVLADANITIRAQVDQIMQSVGAAWSVAADGIAALWPFTDDGDTPTTVQAGPLTMQDLKPEASHTDLVNVLRIKYDYNWATGQADKTLQVEDAESIRKYGRIEAEFDAGWLHLERLAQALGDRLLPALATPRWVTTWTAPDIHARPGDWVHITNPANPIQGRHRLVSAQPDIAGMRTELMVIGQAQPEQIERPSSIRITTDGATRITTDGATRVTG